MSTKERILEAVVAYIKDNAHIENVTLSKIAEKAHIGKSTVYEHFTSKDQLIEETYQYLLLQYDQVLTQSLQASTFKFALMEVINHILFVMEDAHQIMSAIMNHQRDFFLAYNTDIEDMICSIQERMEVKFRIIINMGITEGIVFNHEDKPYVRYVLHALIFGLLSQYVSGKMEMSKEEILQLIYDQIVVIINQ